MTTEKIFNIVKNLTFLSEEVITIIVGMLPVSELRGAIPLAVFKFGFPIHKAFLLSVLGNILPVVPVLLLIDPVSKSLMRFKLFKRFFDWWFERTRRHSEVVEKYEALGLMIFVAIPLPMTGAWSGCIAAYLFNIRLKYSIPSIIAGVLIAGLIVSLATAGIIRIF